MRTIVVLPDPLGPIRPRIVPWSTSSETRLAARTSSNVLVAFSRRTTTGARCGDGASGVLWGAVAIIASARCKTGARPVRTPRWHRYCRAPCAGDLLSAGAGDIVPRVDQDREPAASARVG